jgi:hypothetical protein
MKKAYFVTARLVLILAAGGRIAIAFAVDISAPEPHRHNNYGVEISPIIPVTVVGPF